MIQKETLASTFLAFLFVVMAATPLACIADEVEFNLLQSRIVGGVAVNPDEDYPFMASVQFRNGVNFSHGCGGSLIAPDIVLSAAHCFNNALPQNVKVVIGTKRQSQLGKAEVKDVSEIIVFPEYLINRVGDVALLKLTTPSAAEPVKLATRTFEQGALSMKRSVRVIGWGLLQQGGVILPDQLMKVDVPLIDTNTCLQSYPGAPDLVADAAICAGIPVGGIDACQGDSGGPLFSVENGRVVQRGVVRWGDGWAGAGPPGVYASVGAFEPWILENAEGQGDFVDNSSSVRMGFTIPGQPLTETTTLVNHSTQTVTVLGVETTQDVSDAFTINDTACQNVTLISGQGCPVTITATQQSAGDFVADLKARLVGEVDPIGITKASVNVLSAVEAADLDISGLLWFTGGDAGWASVVDASAVGQSALGVSNLSNGQLSVLATSITGPNVLNYSVKLSSEAQFDVLRVMVDDQMVESISGDLGLNWVAKTVAIPPGNHVISFVYEKDLTDASILVDEIVQLDAMSLAQPLSPVVVLPAVVPPLAVPVLAAMPAAASNAGLFGSAPPTQPSLIAAEAPEAQPQADGFRAMIASIMNIIQTIMNILSGA